MTHLIHGTIKGTHDIAYFEAGAGEPIVLVHGLASSKHMNWVHPNWVAPLVHAGYRVIAFDNRGHGESAKLYDPQDYHMKHMVGDVVQVMDHLNIQKAHIMGYSMGARITAHMALSHSERMKSALLGGLGHRLVTGMIDQDEIIAALEAPSLDAIHNSPRGHMFRNFAEKTGSDLKALAACMKAGRNNLSEAQLTTIAVPTHIVVGGRDVIAGSGADLAALIPNAEFVDIPNRDHMPVVGDKLYKQAVLSFLEKHK